LTNFFWFIDMYFTFSGNNGGFSVGGFLVMLLKRISEYAARKIVPA
jgi:hypothetical protein